MTLSERAMLSRILIYSAAALAASLGFAALYLLSAGVPMLPIYWFMLGFAALCIAGVAFSGFALGGAVGAPSRLPRLTLTPDRLAHAGFIAAVVVGSGGATAVGLGALVWLWASVGVAAAYAGVVFLIPERTGAAE